MTVERSELGELTTKADYNQHFDSSYQRVITSGQWHIENNEIISYNFYLPLPTSGRRKPTGVIWSGTTTNNDVLEYGIIQRNYNSSYTYQETNYFDCNTLIPVYGNYQSFTDNTADQYAWTLYVKRKDGGVLTPSSMETSVVSVELYVESVVVYTTAIPQDWLTGTVGNYTTDFATMTTVVPTVCDIDDTEFNAFIDIPNKIVAGINLCILGVGSLLNLKYVTFLVCFVLIVGLIAWLIH